MDRESLVNIFGAFRREKAAEPAGAAVVPKAVETIGTPALLSDGTPDMWITHPKDIQPNGFMEP